MRTILHVDLDAFFASVEQLDDPALAGRPVLVGGTGPRGVVAAASYEARAFGCRSAMPTAVARRLCPHAVVVKPRGDRYSELSRRVFELLESATPLIQPLSIDEAFLDVTGSVRLLGEGRAIGEKLREAIKRETGLTASVGVAPNKFLAKLASDLEKPDGLVVIEPQRVREVLDPLPVSRIPGVGPAAEKRLHGVGVRTIGELARLPEGVASSRLGSFGSYVWRLAQGEDDRPVTPDREAKSIGHERTFGADLEDAEEVRAVMLREAEDVARRVRRHGLCAKGVTVKIRFGDFKTITRSATLECPTDSTKELAASALRLFDAWTETEGFRPVRLIGVTATHLSRGGQAQLSLFDAPKSREKQAALDKAADEIAAKFGKDAIRSARAVRRPTRD